MVSPAAIAFMERNNREVRHSDPTYLPESVGVILPFEGKPDPHYGCLPVSSICACLSLLCQHS